MRPHAVILEQYALGNHLSDQEMIWLLLSYREVAKTVQVFGQKYMLVANDARMHENLLRGYLDNRGYFGKEWAEVPK